MFVEKKGYKKYEKSVRVTPTLDHLPKITGPDFSKDLTLSEFLDSYSNMGLQGSNIGQGISIINNMLKEKEITIFLGLTSNMISSGIRDIVTFLVKHKMVSAIVVSAGGVEEDILKTFKPFRLGTFDAQGKILLDNCIGRIGNIFVTAEHYLFFERFLNPILDRIHQEKKVISSSDFIKELGREVNDESSYLYWAQKNNIPVFCPALTDGAIGDLLVFQSNRNREIVLDTVKDNQLITKMALNATKTGAIILGGGTPKHYILNANIFRDGLDYAVYVNVAQPEFGSDSGGNQEEAITWAKIKPEAQRVKIFSDASIVFPMLVAGSFAKKIK